MDISKVQMPNGEVYNIKDAETRRILNVLLGIEPANNSLDEENEKLEENT